MITDAQFEAWLQDPTAVRVMLVEAEFNAGSTLRLATQFMNVNGNDYLGIVKNPFTITNNISVFDFTSSISFSDIELANANGEYDYALNYVWAGKPIRVYIGDAKWTDLANDFRLIFSGVIGNMDARDRNTLNLTVRTPLENLNTGAVGNVLGNYFQGNLVATNIYDNPNKNSIKPLVFGEVHNITPLQTDRTYLEYMVCDGAVEQIIEVRDNGVPIPFLTVALTGKPAIPAGSFRLRKTPVGTITCDVQGLKESVNLSTGALQATYTNTVGNIIATIMLKYGKNITFQNLDLAKFNAVSQYPVGVYITDRFNPFQLCEEIAKGCAMGFSTSSNGKIALIEPRKASAGSGGITITDSDMLLNSLQISFRNEISAGTRIGYAKNWTIQNNLLTGIPEEHKALYSSEYSEVFITNSTVETTYSAEKESVLEPTYLISTAAAESVRDVKQSISSVQSTVFSCVVTSKYMGGITNYLVPGTKVNMTSSRFGLNNTPGVVVSTTPDWFKGTLAIEVLV